MNPWLQGTHSALVPLPKSKHVLYLHASGPARKSPTTPVVILEHGLGGSTLEWAGVVALLSSFARVYVYERAGYVPSSPWGCQSSNATTAVTTAAGSYDANAHADDVPTPSAISADLRDLLNQVGVHPPWVLIGHSYGGWLVKQFLADWGTTDDGGSNGDVAGMVLVDLAPVAEKGPKGWRTLLGEHGRYADVVGLSENQVLGHEQWEAIMEREDLNQHIAMLEASFQDVGIRRLRDRLAGKRPLGDARLSIIYCDMARDFRKVYEYGVKHGHGTEEIREALRKRLEVMSEVEEKAMREDLTLSSNSRFVKPQGKSATHGILVVDPEFVVKEILWVLGRPDATS